MLEHLKLAAQDAGINLFITNSEKRIETQLNALTGLEDRPTLLISWDINVKLNINEFGLLDNPDVDIVALLVSKPDDLSKDLAEEVAQAMGVKFEQFIQFLYSRLVRHSRTSTDIVSGVSYVLVPKHGAGKHSGVLGKFSMKRKLDACPEPQASPEEESRSLIIPICKIVEMKSASEEYMSSPVDNYIPELLNDLNMEFRFENLEFDSGNSLIFMDQSNFVATVLKDSVSLIYDDGLLSFIVIKDEVEIINLSVTLEDPISDKGIVAVKGTNDTVNMYIDHNQIGSVPITDNESPQFTEPLSELNFNAQIDLNDQMNFDINPISVDFTNVKINDIIWNFEDYLNGKVNEDLTTLHTSGKNRGVRCIATNNEYMSTPNWGFPSQSIMDNLDIEIKYSEKTQNGNLFAVDGVDGFFRFIVSSGILFSIRDDNDTIITLSGVPADVNNADIRLFNDSGILRLMADGIELDSVDISAITWDFTLFQSNPIFFAARETAGNPSLLMKYVKIGSKIWDNWTSPITINNEGDQTTLVSDGDTSNMIVPADRTVEDMSKDCK